MVAWYSYRIDETTTSKFIYFITSTTTTTLDALSQQRNGVFVMGTDALNVDEPLDSVLSTNAQDPNDCHDRHPLSNTFSTMESDSNSLEAASDFTKTTGQPLSFLSDQPYIIKRVPSKRKRKHLKDNQESRSFRTIRTDNKSRLDTDDTLVMRTLSTAPTKLNFSLHESFQQSTKKTIYSLTFSGPLQEYISNDASCTTATNTMTHHLLACCSHRQLVIYRVTTTTAATEIPTMSVAVSESFDDDDEITGSSGTNHNAEQIEENNRQRHARIEYCFMDTDENEDYYACTFVGRIQPTLLSAVDTTTTISSNSSSQLICVGGKNARILVIDYTRNHVVRTLSGHGGEILDLQVCPTDEWLLLSSSQDYSCRLWNVRAVHEAPIAIFGGHNGHGDGVTTMSWHRSGTQFVSGGIDNTIKIWEISNDIKAAIVSSQNLTDSVINSPHAVDQVDWIATVVVQFPIYSTNRMHAHCVDCVEFLGDLIVSKSTENVVQLWYPILQNERSRFGDILQPPSSEEILLKSFHYTDGDYWFIRFAVEPNLKLLAVGTSRGTITIWLMGDEDGQSVLKPIRNLNTNRRSTIRCVRFSPDGSMLFASTDDGSIFQWIVSFE